MYHVYDDENLIKIFLIMNKKQ